MGVEKTILSWLFIFWLLEAWCRTSGVPAAVPAPSSSNNRAFCLRSTYFWPRPFYTGKRFFRANCWVVAGALNTHSPFPLLCPPPNRQPVINSYQMPSYSHSPSWVHTAPTRAAEMQPSWDIVRGGSWESPPARLRGSHVPPSSHQTEKQTCLARLAAACFQMPHSPGSRQALWHQAGALVHEGKTAVDRKTNGLYCLFLLLQRTEVTSHWSLRKDALIWEILKIRSVFLTAQVSLSSKR